MSGASEVDVTGPATQNKDQNQTGSAPETKPQEVPRTQPDDGECEDDAGSAAAIEPEADDIAQLADTVLEPGQIKRFSCHIPSLDTGNYTITVNQDISIGDDILKPSPFSTKRSRITAPRYVLPPDSIHSSYPHHGHAELAHVLPHLVFNDPNLPWERPMKESDKEPGARMPWLGIVAFELDELHDGNQALPALSSLQPSASMAYRMDIATLWKMRSSVSLPFPEAEMAKGGDTETDERKPDGEKSSTNVDAIFLNSELFRHLFCQKTEVAIASSSVDRAKKPETTSSKFVVDDLQFKICMEKYKYLAHVRDVHTHGMAKSAASATPESQNKEFGVVVSPRSGPTHLMAKAEKPPSSVPMVAHLVSLDGIEDYVTWPLPAEKKAVGLVSLYSWSYECLPSGGVDYAHLMTELGKGLSPLRLPDDVIKKMTGVKENSKSDAVNSEDIERLWLTNRLKNGYSFIKHRLPTGEMTVALYRGPLTPVLNKRDPSKDQPTASGSDLQILDHASGLADISYHLAWELGRSLAASDRFMTAAVMRIRAKIQKLAVSTYHTTNQHTTSDNRPLHTDRKAILGSMDEVFEPALKGQVESSMDKRWNKHRILQGSEDELENRISDSDLAREIAVAAMELTKKHSSIVDQEDQTTRAEAVAELAAPTMTSVDKTNPHQPATIVPKPAQTTTIDKHQSDWAVIAGWCLDKLMLQNIPTVYIFPEAETLPEESLRTFHVDDAWMDAFIDGALSVANHALFGKPDLIRQELKKCFNCNILNPIEGATQPQIPQWGFFMRSKIVQAFPDLRIEAPWTGQSKDRAEMARVTHLAPDVLWCLFDRRPEDGLFDQIKISQPPHQQRFSLGDSFDDTSLVVKFKLIRNQGKKDDAMKKIRANENNEEIITWYKAKDSTPIKRPPIYDWDSRCLKFPEFAQSCIDVCRDILGTDLFSLERPDAALTGVQLNDVSLSLYIDPNILQDSQAFSPTSRTLPERSTQILNLLERVRKAPLMGPSLPVKSTIFPP